VSETAKPTTDDAQQLADVVRDVLAELVGADGGTIEWVGLRDGVAEVRLGGACAGCPGQSFTVRTVVLPALRAVDPTIKSVRIRPAL
jgi:Fe-S cluster biogenesis protein NfuA